MKFSELFQKTKSELYEMLGEKREKLRQFRFNLTSGKVKNIREIREIKKDIARILTRLNSKIKDKKLKTKT